MGTKPQQGGHVGALLQECGADPNWNILVDALKAGFPAQQSLKKSTDIHIIIMYHFACKIHRLLLCITFSIPGFTTLANKTWPSHADIAD